MSASRTVQYCTQAGDAWEGCGLLSLRSCGCKILCADMRKEFFITLSSVAMVHFIRRLPDRYACPVLYRLPSVELL
jgi:hypothetical protein